MNVRAWCITPAVRPTVLAFTVALIGACTLTVTLTSGCASAPEVLGPLRAETVVAVTDKAELIRFNAGQPQRLLQRKPLVGLEPGERLLGVDYRVARGALYAVPTSGRVDTLEAESAQLARVGSGAAVVFSGQNFGVDFNPVADRIRALSDSGQSLRLHPNTGVLTAVGALGSGSGSGLGSGAPWGMGTVP